VPGTALSLPQDPARGPLPAEGRIAWLRALVAIGGLWVLLALVHLLAPGTVRLRTWPPSYLLLEAVASASLAWRAWHSRGKVRLAWGLLALSASLEVPNLLVEFLTDNGYVPESASALSSALGLCTGFLVLAGILCFPKGIDRPGSGLRRTLDSLIFATSLLFLLWVMGIQGAMAPAREGIGLRVFVSYLNVASLGGSLVFMTSSNPERIHGPLGWLGASALAWLVAISSWTLAGLPSVVATEPWILVAGCIPVFQALAAWSPRTVEEYRVPDLNQRRLARLLPYLPVAVGIVVLAALLAWATQDVTRETFGIFLATVVLLLLRMVLAIRDLQAARNTLEDRVLERTRALEHAQGTILKAERMNALATLGAGLAHDLNNFLGAIRNSAELLRMDLEEGSTPDPASLARIMDASDRAGNLTQRLMAYGRKDADPARQAPVDFSSTVARAEELLRMLLPRTIQLSVRDEAPGCQVRLEVATLEQVLVNLVSNARDALPEGGRIALWLHPGTLPGGAPAVVLDVADDGPGIPDEVQKYIFDPFFTTKPEGKGTGLGLATVRTLMEDLGGTVDFRSRAGEGTTFSLVFPRVGAEMNAEVGTEA